MESSDISETEKIIQAKNKIKYEQEEKEQYTMKFEKRRPMRLS